MATFEMKRGETLRLQFKRTKDDGPVDLSGIAISADLREESLVDTFTVTRVDDTAGIFELSAPSSATRDWPLTSRLQSDIVFVDGETVQISDTFTFDVRRGVTSLS